MQVYASRSDMLADRHLAVLATGAPGTMVSSATIAKGLPMCDSEERNAEQVLGIAVEVVALLKEEYFHLQKTVEDFDQHALSIKASSVTTSMVGIAVSFLHSDASVLSLLAALSSLSFWMTEALWKQFQ